MHHPLDDISGAHHAYDGSYDRRRFPRDPDQSALVTTAARLKRVAKHHCMWNGKPPTFCKQIIDLFMASTKPTRFGLALTAAGYAVFLSMPGEIFVRPAYIMMKALLPERVWLVLFTLYAALAMLNLFRRRHVLISLLVNAFGLALYTISFVSFLAGGLHPTPITVSDFFFMALAAMWVLIRTPTEND